MKDTPCNSENQNVGIDVPYGGHAETISNVEKLTPQEITASEQQKDGEYNRWYQRFMASSSLSLLYICLCIVIVLYIVDVTLINKNMKNSDLFPSMFEMFKLLITTVIGYLFADRMNKNK